MANSAQFETSEVTHDNTDVTHSYSPIPQLKRSIDDTGYSENFIQCASEIKNLLTADDDSLFYPIRSKLQRNDLLRSQPMIFFVKDKIPNSKLALLAVQYATNILQGRII